MFFSSVSNAAGTHICWDLDFLALGYPHIFLVTDLLSLSTVPQANLKQNIFDFLFNIFLIFEWYDDY